MKNLFTLAVALLLTTLSFAQTTRPEKVDDENIDKFVNSAFDLNEKKNGYSAEIAKIETKLAAYETAGKKLADTTITKFETRIKKSEDNYDGLLDELEDVANKGGDMLDKATKITPATKIPKATKNAKAAVSIINQTREGTIPDKKALTSIRARWDKLKAANATK